MTYNGLEFYVYRNMLPPYAWNYLIYDKNKSFRYESVVLYKTERDAINAAFKCMEDLIENEILNDTKLPQLN